jgi:dTDP-4-dehydrorhamnose 3,5-epimerase
MEFEPLPLKGAYLIEPEPFQDNRGLFARIFCHREFEEIGNTRSIAQINHSITAPRYTIRGMHFQVHPKVETKLVKCLKGSVFDVIVDLRGASSTFGAWHGELLSSENMRMIYIPEGFAHGFQTLSENAELLYLHTEYYDPDYESGVAFDDPDLGIEWPSPPKMVSVRDRNLPRLSQLRNSL